MKLLACFGFLPPTIRMIAPGVVTTRLSHLPAASNSATEVLASSESRPAAAGAAAYHHETECLRHAYHPTHF